MQLLSGPPFRPRWGPALATFAFLGAAGGIGGAGSWLSRQVERGRAEALVLELEERSRAAARVRARLTEVVSSTVVPAGLWAGLGSVAEPPDVPPSGSSATWLGVLGVALVGAALVHLRWSRPLAEIEAALARGEPPAPTRGAASVRSLSRAAALALERIEDGAQMETAGWRAALEHLARGAPLDGLPPEPKSAAEAARSRARREGEEERDRSRAAARALAEAEAVEAGVSKAALAATEGWREASSRARSAVERLARVEVETQARNDAEDDRARGIREATAHLQSGLTRAARRAEELADQASRAVDAAAAERARAARVARGGRAGPVEAPPLDRWAAELGDTARALRDVVSAVELPPSFERGPRRDLPQDVLTALLDSVSATHDAVQLSGPLVGAIRSWAHAHGGGIASLARRAGEGEGGRTLEQELEAVEAAASTAEAGIEAMTDRVRRLVEAMRS